MKCPVCKERVNELDEECPNCKTNFDEYDQHTKMNTKEFKITNTKWIWGGIIPIIIVLIFIPYLIDSKKSLEATKQETNLIKEEKIIYDSTIIEEVASIFKSRNQNELKRYLAEDFEYIGNNRNTSKHIGNFWSDLKYLVENNYNIEKRDNSIKDEETYFIYWNTNDIVKEKTDRLYCLQKISIYLRKTVETDKITYKIYKIMLTNNN